MNQIFAFVRSVMVTFSFKSHSLLFSFILIWLRGPAQEAKKSTLIKCSGCCRGVCVHSGDGPTCPRSMGTCSFAQAFMNSRQSSMFCVIEIHAARCRAQVAICMLHTMLLALCTKYYEMPNWDPGVELTILFFPPMSPRSQRTGDLGFQHFGVGLHYLSGF